MHDVLKANPWLGGWLVRGKGVGSFDSTHRLWYDPTGEESAPGIYQQFSFKDIPVGRSTPFVAYETVLSKSATLVKNNPCIVNRKGEPVFRVTVIVESPADSSATEGSKMDQSTDEIKGFSLLVSMSHVCGDAHTYYRIYNMIVGVSAVTALIPHRELGFSQRVVDLMGKQEANYVYDITTDPAWAKLFRVSSSVEDDPSSDLKGCVFIVNRHWITNIKAEGVTCGNISDIHASTFRSPMSDAFLYEMESAQNPTQSTNNILVSWFWNLIIPDVGMMAVNLRDRIDLVSNNHVGNYCNPIPYTSEDFRSPQLIHESLKRCKRSGVSDTGGPTMLPRANPDVTFSIVTNWSSFRPLPYQPVVEHDEDECGWNNNVVLIRHLPLVCPKQMFSIMPKRMSFMVIFSSGKDDIGVVILAPNRVVEEIGVCGIVKDMIAEF